VPRRAPRASLGGGVAALAPHKGATTEHALLANITRDLQASDGLIRVPLPTDAPDEVGALARALAHFQEQLFRRIDGLAGEIELHRRTEQQLSALTVRHRQVVDSTDDAIIACDMRGVINFWNPSATRLYGFSSAEAVGMQVEAIVPLDRREEFAALRASMARGEHVRSFETIRQRRDGRPVNVSLTVSPTYALDGSINGFSGIARDISERFLAEERLQLAVEAAPSGMLMVDRSGTIVLVNAEVERLFGYARTELLDSAFDRLVPGDVRPLLRSARDSHFSAVPLTGAAGRGRDVQMLRKDGTSFPAEVTVNPIHAGDGVCVLVAVVDVTSRRENEQALERRSQELERRSQELERSNADLQEFAYVASHDLQEPLRAVGGYCQLLASRYRGKLDARADEFIDFAVDGSKRMKRLIDDLLLYSRVGTRTMWRAVDLNLVVSEALRNLRAAIEDTGARIEVAPLPTVPGDPTRLVQLFQNLIGNAIKFRGTEPLVVRFEVTPEGSGHRIDIQDNGIGFDTSQAERAFKMFQRLHPPGHYEGTGIGLALCRRIVGQHGGRIWATGTPGAGATFSFTLMTAEQDS
jgi:PAS domain S-box-containing protein